MYTFKLQSVLDHRKSIEDERKKELVEIRSKISSAEQLLESLQRKEMKTTRALKLDQTTGISSHQVVTYQTYLKRLKERITEQEKFINDVRVEEANKQDEVVEAVKKRKILEKLRSKGIDRYRKMILDHEMKFIDEIAVSQFIRKAIDSHGDPE
jgi:flagellar FliJ protein